ncbi:MAG: metal transporter [Burkholderiaceae bacterium]
MVRLDAAVQQRSGIVVQPLAATTRRIETMAYGTVIDLQALVALRGRHDAATADAEVARATAGASHAELERDRTLYADQQNVSLKALQAAQAADRRDQARVDAAALASRNIEAGAAQQFGATLARWALQRDSGAFERFLARRDVVVRVTLPAGVRAAPEAIEVQSGGGDRRPASWVSAAAQVDPGMVGSSHLYRVTSAWPVGASVVAYLPGSAQAMPASFVPSSAVVWYAGRPWVYVQDSATRFARRPLLHATETDGGYVVVDGLHAAERVVTQGAGLLLSEEQRPPPAGTGCKDPECD